MRIADIEGCLVIAGRHPSRHTSKSIEQASQPGSHFVLRTAAIDHGTINHHLLTRPDGFVAPPGGPFTQEGDIVLETTSPFAAAYIGPNDTGLFVPNICTILRFHDAGLHRYDPRFIVGYLNLPATNDLIRSQASGGRMLSLNSKQIDNLEIPDTPLDEQRLLGDLIQAHIDQEQIRIELQSAESTAVEAAYLTCPGIEDALFSRKNDEREEL